MNPYDWQKHTPRVEVPRDDLRQVAARLREGGSFVVLGGRGMGKSVFLRQLHTRLEEQPETYVVLFRAPPTQLTVDECLSELAKALKVPLNGSTHCHELIEPFLARPGAPQELVLLYDEFDRYAPLDSARLSEPPGRQFFNDLELARRGIDGLGVLAAGSIGVFTFRDILGSSYLSRAEFLRLGPFGEPETALLTRAFDQRGTPLSQGVIEALLLATGGIPALLTYGLQKLWPHQGEIDERHVAEVFIAFEQSHRGYLDDIQAAFSNPRLSRAPQRVWQVIRASRGRGTPREKLVEACRGSNEALDLKLADVLDLLRVAGMVRVESSTYSDDPVLVYPNASLLNLPTNARSADGIRQRFRGDLCQLLETLHRSGADFFRPKGPSESGKRLVPEAVFAAHLLMGFELLSWRSEREAQSGAGRADLKLWHNGAPERALVEMKIWGRNDFMEAQKQIESYWTQEVTVGAVVQITDVERPDWPEQYRARCLENVDRVDELPLADSPIRAGFACTSTTPDGQTARVDHFLLRLPRRV